MPARAGPDRHFRQVGEGSGFYPLHELAPVSPDRDFVVADLFIQKTDDDRPPDLLLAAFVSVSGYLIGNQ